MAVELLIRAAEGLGEGIASSFITGALDTKHAKKGGWEIADVIFTTAALTGVCILASMYLYMPPYVPIALSVLMRVGHEARELFIRLKGED